MCTVPPESVTGPDTTVSATGNPDEAAAAIVKSGSPNVFAISAKSIVWFALSTTCVSPADVLAADVLSPSYDAVNACEPADRLVELNVAWPLGSRTRLSTAVPPSKNVTRPVGMVAPPLLTVAVIVTGVGSAYCDSAALDISVVVVLAVNV